MNYTVKGVEISNMQDVFACDDPSYKALRLEGLENGKENLKILGRTGCTGHTTGRTKSYYSSMPTVVWTVGY